MTKPIVCEAYQKGDCMYCDKCGVNWDCQDDNPPECTPKREREIIKIRDILFNGQGGELDNFAFEPSEYLKRLRKLSNDKRFVHSNVSFIKLLDYTEGLERERFIAKKS